MNGVGVGLFEAGCIKVIYLKEAENKEAQQKTAREGIPARRNGMCAGLEVGVSSHVPGKTENPSWDETRDEESRQHLPKGDRKGEIERQGAFYGAILQAFSEIIR